MSNKYVVEIERLHRFFVDWFTGRIAQTDANFAAFADAMAAEFVIVGPDGRLSEREQLLKGLWQTHGRYQPDFEITIKNPIIRHRLADVTIATYEEWQLIDGRTTSRLSTVVFVDQPAAPGHLHWINVHETWLPS